MGTQNKTAGVLASSTIELSSSKMKAFVALCVIATVGALPMAKEEGPMEKFVSALRECVEADTMLCLKV